MKRLFSISLLLIITFDLCIAQNQNPFTTTSEYINSYSAESVKYNEAAKNVKIAEIQGSPFLTDSFVLGTVYANNYGQVQNIPMRYNIFTDNIEYIMGESSVLELKNPETVDKVEFGDYKLIYLSQSNKNKSGNGFFIVLAEGNATLLLKPAVTLHKPTLPGGYIDAQPPRFSRNPDTFYIRVGKNQAKIIRNKRNLITSFPDYRDQLSNYIKEHDTKISDQKSISELVQFYNSL